MARRWRRTLASGNMSTAKSQAVIRCIMYASTDLVVLGRRTIVRRATGTRWLTWRWQRALPLQIWLCSGGVRPDGEQRTRGGWLDDDVRFCSCKSGGARMAYGWATSNGHEMIDWTTATCVRSCKSGCAWGLSNYGGSWTQHHTPYHHRCTYLSKNAKSKLGFTGMVVRAAHNNTKTRFQLLRRVVEGNRRKRNDLLQPVIVAPSQWGT